MALIRSRLGRLLTAIGVGLVVEILLLAGGTAVGSRFPQPWDERVWAATQEPAYHLVDWLARVHRPGFEEQGAYFVLIPLSQWLMWSAVSYLFLSRKKRNPVTVTVELSSSRSPHQMTLFSLIKSLFLLKVIPEVIDPVMGSFQLGRIKRQLRGFNISANALRPWNSSRFRIDSSRRRLWGTLG